MPFVCTIKYEEPVDSTIIHGEGEFIVRIPIGYDSDTDVIFSAVAALSPLPGHYPDGYELAFNVVEADAGDDHMTYRWDGLDTKRSIFDPKHRAVALSTICCAIRELISHVQPRLVTMTTYNADLPASALRKNITLSRQSSRRPGMWSGNLIPTMAVRSG